MSIFRFYSVFFPPTFSPLQEPFPSGLDDYLSFPPAYILSLAQDYSAHSIAVYLKVDYSNLLPFSFFHSYVIQPAKPNYTIFISCRAASTSFSASSKLKFLYPFDTSKMLFVHAVCFNSQKAKAFLGCSKTQTRSVALAQSF